MNLSKETLTVLKSFEGLNKNMYVRPGNVIRILKDGNGTYGRYIADEEFSCGFGIYDLAKFNRILSVFENPSIEFEEIEETIVDEEKIDEAATCQIGESPDNEDFVGHKQLFNYALTTRNFLHAIPPNRDLEVRESDILVKDLFITIDDIKKLDHGCKILGLNGLHFYSDPDGRASITGLEQSLDDSSKYELESTNSNQYTVYLDSDQKIEGLDHYIYANAFKIIPGDYKLTVTRNVLRFESAEDEGRLTYWMACRDI